MIFNQGTKSNNTALGTWLEYIILAGCHYYSSCETSLGATTESVANSFEFFQCWSFSLEGRLLLITKVQLESSRLIQDGGKKNPNICTK